MFLAESNHHLFGGESEDVIQIEILEELEEMEQANAA